MIKFKTNKFLILFLILLSIFGIWGCSSDSDSDPKPTQSDFNNGAYAAIALSRVTSSLALSYSSLQSGIAQGDIKITKGVRELKSNIELYTNNGCPSVGFSLGTGGINLKISYSQGCEVMGMSVSGSIDGTLSLSSSEGLKLVLSVDNLVVDNIKSTGTISIIASSFEELKLSLAGTVTITDESGKTKKLVIDNMTGVVDVNQTFMDPSDDVYTLNGTGTYTDVDNKSYKVTITNVKAKFMCFFPVSGTMILEADKTPKTIIDFGNGDCDTKVTITVGGQSQEIDLTNIVKTT
ncbi:MAG: hypothetical protein HQK76_03645 [Desulfobacterales bacterium]|nr:hypothetical protein [Desulfobacterales bacterium]